LDLFLLIKAIRKGLKTPNSQWAKSGPWPGYNGPPKHQSWRGQPSQWRTGVRQSAISGSEKRDVVSLQEIIFHSPVF
jgi:hypothetical protein